MPAKQIPCYFPVNSLSSCESPVFMRGHEKIFSHAKKFPVLFSEEGVCREFGTRGQDNGIAVELQAEKQGNQ